MNLRSGRGHWIGMKFEYDPEKSAVNKAKHGIDFEAANHFLPAKQGQRKGVLS